ncbi:MAG: hypothetical protein Q9214_002398, partial [Letrouitia sp. 1 TL-2023]
RLTSNSTIDGLSHDVLDDAQTYILSSTFQYTVASALAFMQGLYPPANLSSSQEVNRMSILTNGTILDYPLGGYQYPHIFTYSPADPNSIFVAGDFKCSSHENVAMDYFDSQEYSQIKSATQTFYDTFQPALGGFVQNRTVSYDMAYPIYDYLKYSYMHNQSIRNELTDTDLSRTRALASEWVYHVNSNTSTNDPKSAARTIAGRTMATQVINSLLSNFESQGEENKLSVLFGSFEPMIAFASLAQLPSKNQNFFALPEDGSSMVFEMFTPNHNNSEGYPRFDDLNVRFLFRNGTNSSSPLLPYPLFGLANSQMSLSLAEFNSYLSNITISDISDWCNICGGQEVAFCPIFNNSPSSSAGSQGPSNGLKPAVAGVIGALVTLAVLGILLALAMVLGGIRLTRKAAKKRSNLGGFKAGEKLASDLDLPSAKGNAGIMTIGEGKDRVTSWELAERGRVKETEPHHPSSIRRPSLETDDLDSHLSIQPTKVDERADLDLQSSDPSSGSHKMASRVYSIVALLRFGAMKQPAGVELRINPAALTGFRLLTSLVVVWNQQLTQNLLENIFRLSSSQGHTKRQENVRPRLETQSSSVTNQFKLSEEGLVFAEKYIRPSRQPFDPPRSSLAQKHEGFARFLKQHASPPHHRVTAGGRIVPAGPLSPPPMMKLHSIDGMIMKPSSIGRLPAEDYQNKTNNGLAQFHHAIGAAPLASQKENVHRERSFQPSQDPRLAPSISLAENAHKSQIPGAENALILGPLPAGALPIGPLPDGSTLVFFNGASYRSWWNGLTTVMDPLQPNSSVAQAICTTSALAQTSFIPHLYSGGYHPGLATSASIMTFDGANGTHINPQQQDLPTDIQFFQAHHENLRSELTTLDKFIALHMHEFSAHEHAQHTARRKELVEEIDSIRVSMANRESQHPASLYHLGSSSYDSKTQRGFQNGDTSGGSSALFAGNVNSTTPTTPVSIGKVYSQPQQEVRKDALTVPKPNTNTCLSPDAVPFVPSQQKYNNAVLDDVCRGTHQVHVQQLIPHDDVKTAPTSTQVLDWAERTESKDKSINSGSDYYGMAVTPVVSSEEAEYADRLGLNPPDIPKRFCTTIAEFQEVVRRVREQAQKYGCKGGQSKDPAYDAEQDIRWAMADRDPIPLPTDPPDHVSKPRPWSWNDSVFNYRSDAAKETQARHHTRSVVNENTRDLGYFTKKHRGDSGRLKDTPDCGIESTPRANTLAIQKKPSHTEGGHHPLQTYAGDLPETPTRSRIISNTELQPSTPTKKIQKHSQYRSALSDQNQPSDRQMNPLVIKPPGYPNDQIGSINSKASTGLMKIEHEVKLSRMELGSDLQAANALDEGAKKIQSATPCREGPTATAYLSPLTSFGKEWKPEDDGVLLGSKNSTTIYENKRARDPAIGIKVNLPPTSGIQAGSGPIKVPTFRHSESIGGQKHNEFLRGILKSPRKPTARANLSEPFDMLGRPASHGNRSSDSLASRSANKENVRSEEYQDQSQTGDLSPGGFHFTDRLSPSDMSQSTLAIKARSSLAASICHAHGQLSQFDGAGDALTSTTSHVRNGAAAGSQELFEGDNLSRREQARRYYGGPRDKFDNRGLTIEAFNARSNRPVDVEAHHNEVDCYFNKIHEQERQEIAKQS